MHEWTLPWAAHQHLGFSNQGSEQCTVCAGAQVKNLEAFRRALPESAKMIVAKNTLVSLAADRVEGWSELKQGIKLENAWVFAPEDAISTSVKAFLDFEKKLLEPIPKADRAKYQLTDVSGAFPLGFCGCLCRLHGQLVVDKDGHSHFHARGMILPLEGWLDRVLILIL